MPCKHTTDEQWDIYTAAYFTQELCNCVGMKRKNHIFRSVTFDNYYDQTPIIHSA